MIYADTNFFTNTLIDMSHRSEAESLIIECPNTLPVTWLHRLEIVNALQQCVFLSRQGMQRMRISPEYASAAEGRFFDEVDLRTRFHHSDLDPLEVESVFRQLSHRHTAREGFRTYDILHVSCALVLECDTFWSFDAKARKLARLEGLAVN
jgi:predicted nucleic acid-binding protein